MKTSKLSLLTLLIPILVSVNPALSKSILVTGALEAVAPSVAFPPMSLPQAYVTPFQMAALEGGDSGCKLTGDPSVAKADHGEELVCLFEWTSYPSGITTAGMQVNGYLPAPELNRFDYDISYYSGSALEKVLIQSGVFNIVAKDPDYPVFVSAITELSHGVFEGLDVISYNKSSGLQKVIVEVEKRPYRQVVNMDGVASCVVEIDESSCSVLASSMTIGNGEELQGQLDFLITVDADNGYFKSQGLTQPESYTLKWDYRPPAVDGLFIQARETESGETESHTVGEVTFVLENEQAKLIVDSPHLGLPGDWWVPTASLELKPDPDFNPQIPVFEVNGVDMVELKELIGQPQSNFLLSPIGTPELLNGKYIFTFDMRTVADGAFIPEVTVKDDYNNVFKNEYSVVKLDREAPSVQVMYKGKRFVDDSSVYFLEDLSVIALDTFDGGAEILNVKVNGVDVGLEGETDFIKTLKGTQLNLIPQQSYPLEVMVKDSAGNRHVEAFRIDYMPMDYKLDGADVELYKKVQRLDLDVVQTQGVHCPLYSSETELFERSFGYGEDQRCYLEWVNLPDGTSGSYLRGQHSLTGNLTYNSTESTNEVGYRVWMFDKEGNGAVAAVESQVLSVSDAPVPTLKITQSDVISENFFPVELRGERFATTTSKAINADLELSSDDGQEETVTLAAQRNGRFSETSAYQSLSVPVGTLWDEKTFAINSSYTLDPSLASTDTVRTVYVPSRNIRSRITTNDLRTMDIENPTVTMKFGVYDSSARDFIYDEVTMGEWNVYLAVERRDRETRITHYDPITETKKFTGQSVTFDLDVSNVGYGSYRFIAVAELVSPVDGYSRRILSNSSFYRVLKGGAIEGDIKTYRLSAPVPFSASIVYEPAEREDREALGDIEWEISINGTENWEPVTEYSGATRLRRVIEEAAHYFVRATVTNKFSKKVTVTDSIEILGYEIPKLKTAGPTALYEGETSTLTLYDGEMLADPLKGDIEWSTDGETWELGGNTLDIVGTGERMQVWSRMSYFNNDIAGDASFNSYRKRISVKKPEPLRISIITPRIIEVGKELNLDARVSLATSQLQSEVEKEWVLPNGDIVKGDALTYMPTEEDGVNGRTEITFRTWVKQLKDDTLATKDISIRTWKYEFPNFRFDVNYRTRYAPVTATAVIRKLDNQPETVDFTYNYLPFAGLVKDRESNERLYFQATEPGLAELTVVVTDDRGNEKSFSEILEVLAPPETKIELTASYSTIYMRTPLDASVRSRVVLGHPDDRIAKYEWYLNDVLVPEQTTSRGAFEGLTEGKHQVKVKVTSNFGLVSEQLLDVHVAANQPPACNLSYKQYGSTISLQSGCQDPDGKLATHNWFVDGEVMHVHANNMSITGKEGIPMHFRVVGYDDSGDSSEATLVVTPK